MMNIRQHGEIGRAPQRFMLGLQPTLTSANHAEGASAFWESRPLFFEDK